MLGGPKGDLASQEAASESLVSRSYLALPHTRAGVGPPGTGFQATYAILGPVSDATAFLHDKMPLCRTLGITASSVTADEVVLAIAWSPDLCTAGGVLHGGVLMALADSATASCAFLNLPDGAIATSTIESK